MAANSSSEQAVEAKLDSDSLLAHVMDTMARFSDGEDVVLDFLTRDAVGRFCTSLGFADGRNWAQLSLTDISPKDDTGTELVPADEADKVLTALKVAIEKGLFTPGQDSPDPTLLNDFLPKGQDFQGEPCLGHEWEWRYALGVELEHGRYRGTNVSNNHPVLTGLVVMAHLTEDTLYYARLWVMETEGELLNAVLEKQPYEQVHALEAKLATAKTHLAQRLAEKIGAASDDEKAKKAAAAAGDGAKTGS